MDERRLSGVFTQKVRISPGWRLCDDKEARWWWAFLTPKKEFLQNPHWLAGDAVLIAPVSGRIPCKQGILQGNLRFQGSKQKAVRRTAVL